MLVSIGFLKSALLFISKEQTRYYLTGVYVEPEANGIRLVSTDGHRLFTAIQETDDPQGFEPFIIPGDAIKRALTGYKEALIELNIQNRVLGNVSFTPIDGDFPNWRRIAPSKISGETAQLNPEYVSDFGKIYKFLHGGGKSFGGMGVYIAHNGISPCVVTFGRDDCLALLMPMRSAVGETNEKALDLLKAHFEPDPRIEKKDAA